MERLVLDDIAKVPRVRVTWIDHASVAGWVPLDVINAESNLVTCYTEGFLVKESGKEIVVTTTITADGAICDPFTIGKKMIVKIKRIKNKSYVRKRKRVKIITRRRS